MANSATIEAPTELAAGVGPRVRTPGDLFLRLRARVRRPWLDRDIARGVERPADRTLALRCAQLTGRRERRRLARRLEEVLSDEASHPVASSAVPLDRESVEVARPILTELILSLRSAEPVEARGVLLGWRLLTEAVSPIYAPPGGHARSPDNLWYESLLVLFALRPLSPSRAAAGASR